ncbi:MAG: arylsulfatase [Cytophagales bacterium]|nr:arylsulfatase [Cytophagales bacterium]
MLKFNFFIISLILWSSYAWGQNKPNIIIILADDLGYGDIEPYGQQTIKTPNLSKISKEGIKFTQAYCGNTVCAPSRCALMTGKHMGHAYIRANDPKSAAPSGAGIALRHTDTTLATILKKAGYTTGMFGKWGLGVQNSTGSPEMHGWDYFYGFLNQAHAHHYHTDSLWKLQQGKITVERISKNEYTQDIIHTQAQKFIAENKKNPFFLYYTTQLPHAELAIPDKYMKTYLDKNGKSIFTETPYTGKGSYGRQDQPRAAFAAMVSKLDTDIGSIIAQLQDLQIDNNTIIFFASDNGAHSEGGHDPEYFKSTGNLRGYKRDLYEGGIRTPFIVWSPRYISKPAECKSIIAFWDMLPTIAELADISQIPRNDGKSFVNLIKNPSLNIPHAPLYWESYISWHKHFSQAVLAHPWKMVRYKNGNDSTNTELYNLDNDPYEKNNMAGINKDKTSDLIKLANMLSQKPECEYFIYSKDIFKQDP